MATCEITVSVDMRAAKVVLCLLRLPVLFGIISVDRAASIVARFISYSVK